jgi:hypothetical protein
MINEEKLIKLISNRGRNLLSDSFFLSRKSTSHYVINGVSSAINRRKNNGEEIKVFKWFEPFWLYMEIIFLGKSTFISISIFQGEDLDKEKHQLFRAEWDDYDDDSNQVHSQPHWHITSDFAVAKNFEDMIKNEPSDTFEFFQEARKKIIDIKKIHFAMNGNWSNQESHIHKINNEEEIALWFTGLIIHIKGQLEYCL